jgi:hypothetical protein
MCRNFIISSVYLAGDDVPEAEEVHDSVQRTLDIGTKLLADHSRRGVIDLSRLLNALHRTLLEAELTPVARGVVLARVLEELQGEHWITVASELAHGLNNAQLDGIGSAGLLALARALRAGCKERNERALDRVMDVLQHRAPVEISDADGLFIVADGWGVNEPDARQAVIQALPELRGRLGGCVVVAVDPKETTTSQQLLVEHYRRCAEVLSKEGLETLQRASKFGRVHLLPQSQLLAARAKTYGERAWAALAWLSQVTRPVRERIFVPAESTT